MKLMALPAKVVVRQEDADAFQGFGLSEGGELDVVALDCVEQQLIAKAACVMKIVIVDERDGRRRFKGHCCNIVSEVEELVCDMADCLPRTQHQAKLKVLRPRTATPKLMQLRTASKRTTQRTMEIAIRNIP